MRFRKIIAVIAAAALGVSLCGCTSPEKSESSGKLKVIVTIFPAYDFARQVFGDTADVKMLLKPGQESHSYDPSAKDIVEISGCDLFVYNGGESDQWVESVLKSAPEVETFRMTDAVSLLDEEVTEGMQNAGEHDHDEEEHEDEYDEHVWTSPDNASAIVKALGKRAAELFPENADSVTANARGASERRGALFHLRGQVPAAVFLQALRAELLRGVPGLRKRNGAVSADNDIPAG